MKRIFLTLSVLLVLIAGCSQGSDNIMSGYPGFDKEDHHFVTKSASEIIDDLENKVPGAYYLGFSECPWCRVLVPILEEALTETDTTITYLNVRGSDFANSDTLKNRLLAWDGTLDSDSQGGGSVPFVIVIAPDGSITTHLGTVETQTDPANQPLTDTQTLYLRSRLVTMLKTLSE